MEDILFKSRGELCSAWHLPARSSALETAAGRPCVVMAHGFGGTKDSGLLPFAEGFAAAGIDAFVFDYRGFGTSPGEKRQVVSAHRHRQDFAAAVATARQIAGIDPDRVALWGTSYGGGHVVAVAARDPRIAAVVTQVAAVDGAAQVAAAVKAHGPVPVIRLVFHGLRDMVAHLLRRTPHMLPVVGPAHSLAAMSTPDAEAGMKAFAGETWRNEFTARSVLSLTMNRPVTKARKVRCPLLVQIGDNDAVAPAGALRRLVARAPQATEQHYPIGHFEGYVEPWRNRLLGDQTTFLTAHLSPLRDEAAARPEKAEKND